MCVGDVPINRALVKYSMYCRASHKLIDPQKRTENTIYWHIGFTIVCDGRVEHVSRKCAACWHRLLTHLMLVGGWCSGGGPHGLVERPLITNASRGTHTHTLGGNTNAQMRERT